MVRAKNYYMNPLFNSYISKTKDDAYLKLQEKDAVDVAVVAHHKALKQDDLSADPADVEAIHSEAFFEFQKQGVMLYATDFGDPSKPMTPMGRVLKEKAKRERMIQPTLKDYVILDFVFNDSSDKTLYFNVLKLLNGFKFILYPTNFHPFKSSYRLIIMVDELLDEFNYQRAAERLSESIGVDSVDDAPAYLLQQEQGAMLPSYPFPSLVEKEGLTLIGEGDKYFELDKVGFRWRDKSPYQLEAEGTQEPRDKETFLAATEKYVKAEQEKGRFTNVNDGLPFMQKMAQSVVAGVISSEIAKRSAEILAVGRPDWLEENLQALGEAIDASFGGEDFAGVDPEMMEDLEHEESFSYVNGFATSTGSLKRAFKEAHPNGDPKIDIESAGTQMVALLNNFALMRRNEKNSDNLVYYDPFEGIWLSDDNSLNTLCQVVKPGLTHNEFTTLKSYIASRCDMFDLNAEEYKGTRYIAFNNGVLDIKEWELLELNSSRVQKLHLTTRNKIAIDFEFNPELKEWPGYGPNGAGSWNMRDFLMAYADNDKEIYNYLLIVLSKMLFGSSSWGLHVNIKGDSGDGKGTLLKLARALYNRKQSQVEEIFFGEINTPFPLHNVTEETAVIWFPETNIGKNQLNAEYGVRYYDNLADDSIGISRKHKGNLTYRPGPVFFDGTATIDAQEMDTGPARRTLVFKLPSGMKKKYYKQYFSSNIEKMLKEEVNLQWFVHEALTAYKNFVPEARMDNLRLNLAVESDLDLFPEIAKKWRSELVETDVKIYEFFEDYIEKFIQLNDFTGRLTFDVLYKFYLSWYKSKELKDQNAKYAKSPDNFQKIMERIFKDKGWKVLYKATKTSGDYLNLWFRMNSPENWSFNTSEFSKYYEWPDEFEEYTGKGRKGDKKQKGLFMLWDKEDLDGLELVEKDGKLYYTTKGEGFPNVFK